MKKKEKTFKSILNDYQDMIYRLCCAHVNDSEKRKDLFQNILIRVWKGLDSFNHRASFSTWIYRICINTSIDFVRHENPRRRFTHQADLSDLEIADYSNDLEKDLIVSEKIDIMYQCIARLNFIERTIITLYLEGLSYREIAEIVGISEKNVSVKLTRVKKNLNSCLKDY